MINEIDYSKIADNLAESGYSIQDNFLTSLEVDEILELDVFKSAAENFKVAGIGKSGSKAVVESVRGDRIQWINNDSPQPLQHYLHRIKELANALNRELYLSLKDAEVHMTIYPPGTFYKRHLDQFHRDDHRKLSVITYLNPDWNETNGGELVLYLPNETRNIMPLAGRMVCFRSDLLEHEVLPGNRPRYSLTGWILDTIAGMP